MSLIHRLDGINEILMDKLEQARRDSDFPVSEFFFHVEDRFGSTVANHYMQWFGPE